MVRMAEKSKPIYLYDSEKAKLVNEETLKLWKRYEIDMTLRELSPKTIYGYKNDAFQWFIYIYENQGNECVKDLDEGDVEEFLFFCKQNGNNSRRMKRRMSTISAFYKFLRKKRLITENPMEFIDRPKKDTDITTQTYLTKEQVAEMRKILQENVDKADGIMVKNNALMLQLYALFSLSTMARVNAVRNVRWEMIDFDNRMVLGVLEKEQRVVDLMFNEEVKELLLNLKKFRKENDVADGGYVFAATMSKDDAQPISASTADKWCKKIGKMIGEPTLHPHDFRHSGATLLKNAGMSLEDVSSLLNHMGTDVTKKFYIKEDKTSIRMKKDEFEV